jgi:hypothetical protein
MYDVMFCNSALHWCADHHSLVPQLTRQLNPNGGILAIQVCVLCSVFVYYALYLYTFLTHMLYYTIYYVLYTLHYILYTINYTHMLNPSGEYHAGNQYTYLLRPMLNNIHSIVFNPLYCM